MPVRGEEVTVTDRDVSHADQRGQDTLRRANLQRIEAFVKNAPEGELWEIKRVVAAREASLGLAPAPAEGNQPAGVVDRGLLGCYIHVMSWVLSFALVMPFSLLAVWFYQSVKLDFLRTLFSGSEILGNVRTWQACPPQCTWLDIVVWGTAVGVGMLVSLLLANTLRKRLLNATKKG
jgi:hypothetical protein